MNEWFELISKDKEHLKLRIKKVDLIDTDVFSLMKYDDFCLPCVLMDEKKGVISYSIGNFISLKDVLKQHVFEKEEGYLFLHQLFEDMLATNRNKPVVMDPEFVFVSVYGDSFRFLVLPIKRQSVEFRKEQTKKWVLFISELFQTTTAYELPGYLTVFSQSEEFSLTNLVLGLEVIRRKYYPKKFSSFFKHKSTTFRVAEPMHPIYTPSETIPIVEYHQEATMLLGQINRSCAYLMIDGQRYDLLHEVNLIGRSMACDIRLSSTDVSQKHAKITCQNLRYYIQDLKSSNGTFLNGKKVIRKMRLKNEMHICFANTEAIFYQE